MLKYFFLGISFLLIGCTSSEQLFPIDKKYDEIFEKSKDISLFDKDSIEYYAYLNLVNANKRDLKLFVANLDEDIKNDYLNKLYSLIEYSIKYKYYEPVYHLFGKNVTMDDVKKSNKDELLVKYFKATFNGIKMTVTDVQARVYETKKLDNGNISVTIYSKNFIPLAKSWNNIDDTLVFKNVNNKWVIVDSGYVKIFNKVLNTGMICIDKESKNRGVSFDYNKAIDELNLKTCQDRANKKVINNPLPQLSGLMRTKTSAEFNRDNILFYRGNSECIGMYDFYNGDIDELIVPKAICDKLDLKPQSK